MKFEPILQTLEKDKSYWAYSYQLASYLSFKKEQIICKLPGYGRPDHFQYFPECQKLAPSFLYITETHDYRDFSKDFNGYTQKEDVQINEKYKLVEVSRQ